MKEIARFYSLSNGQVLKMLYTYCKGENVWYVTTVVGKNRRQCNDCVHKTEVSPKVYYGQHCGKGIGFEVWQLALYDLQLFENSVRSTQIRIVAVSKELLHIYKRLIRYGYEVKQIPYKNREKEVLVKYL